MILSINDLIEFLIIYTFYNYKKHYKNLYFRKWKMTKKGIYIFKLGSKNEIYFVWEE